MKIVEKSRSHIGGFGAFRIPSASPSLSFGGQKQRVTIGAAIVKGSPVIYFDEPTSGLDYDSMVRVSNLIEQLSNSGVIVLWYPTILNLSSALCTGSGSVRRSRSHSKS